MKQLNRSILKAYDVPEHKIERATIMQFGDDAAMLCCADRLIDDVGLGVAVVAPMREKALIGQDGLYTLLLRGEANEESIKREIVIQCFTEVVTEERIPEKGADANIEWVLLSEYALANITSAMRFLLARFRAGLAIVPIVVCGADAGCVSRLRTVFEELGEGAFGEWLKACPLYAGLNDTLGHFATPDEARVICTDMNYRDEALHLSEPFARFTTDANLPFGTHADDMADTYRKHNRVFEAMLFVLASLGTLRDNETLADCMKDEPLREKAGRIFMDEIMPLLPYPKEAIASYIIECFTRFENTMGGHLLIEGLPAWIELFRRGALPAIQEYNAQNYTLPQGLVMSLAAMILLYAEVRPDENGVYVLDMGEKKVALREPAERLEAFARYAQDMPADALAYAVLSDRELWAGEDLRQIEGFEEALTRELGALRVMPEEDLKENEQR